MRTKCEKQQCEVSKGGGQGSAPHAGAKIPLNTMLKTSVELIFSWHSVETPSRMLQPWRTHARASSSNSDLWRGAHRFLSRNYGMEQSFPEGPHLVESSHIGEVHQGLYPVGGMPTLGGEECEDGV